MRQGWMTAKEVAQGIGVLCDMIGVTCSYSHRPVVQALLKLYRTGRVRSRMSRARAGNRNGWSYFDRREYAMPDAMSLYCAVAVRAA
jgi:hypothetical protein